MTARPSGSKLFTRAERVILLGLGPLPDLLLIAVGMLAVLATITTVQRLVQVRTMLSEKQSPAVGRRSGQG